MAKKKSKGSKSTKKVEGKPYGHKEAEALNQRPAPEKPVILNNADVALAELTKARN